MSDDFIRNIAARLGYEYDNSGLEKFVKGTDKAVSESKRLALEGKKLTNENKRLSLENKKATLAGKQQTSAWKELTFGTEKLKQSMLELRKQKLENDLKRQEKAANKAAQSVDTLKRGLLGLAAIKISAWSLDIAKNVEKARLRIDAWADKSAMNRIESQFDRINKKSRHLFNKKHLEDSATAVLVIDRNTRRFAKSLGDAMKIAPHLTKSIEEIQTAVAEAVVHGSTGGLEQLGIMSQIDLERMQKRTGISFGDMTIHERESYAFKALRDFSDKLPGGEMDGLISNMQRYKNILYSIGRTIGEDYKPAANFILKHTGNLFRLIANSPVGMFAIKLAASVGGLAAFAVSVLAIAKAFGLLRIMLLSVNKATMILMAKFIAIGLAVLALMLVVEDFWLSMKDPEADTYFNELFKQLPKIQEKFEGIGKAIKDVWETFKGFFDFITEFKTPGWVKELMDFKDFFSFGNKGGSVPGTKGMSTETLNNGTIHNKSNQNSVTINGLKVEVSPNATKAGFIESIKNVVGDIMDAELNEVDMAFGTD